MSFVILKKSTDDVINPDSFQTIDWESIEVGAGLTDSDFWTVGTPDRMTVPASLNGNFIELFAILHGVGISVCDIFWSVEHYNSSDVQQAEWRMYKPFNSFSPFQMRTPPLQVSTGDYFIVNALTYAPATRNIDASRAFFGMATDLLNRQGFFRAELISNEIMDVSTFVELTPSNWRVEFDTSSVWDAGTGRMVIPEGVNWVWPYFYWTNGSGVGTEIAVRCRRMDSGAVDIETRELWSERGATSPSGSHFGPIKVNEGDILAFEAYQNISTSFTTERTLQSDITVIGAELFS